jgi:hypothetical protein
MRRVTRNGVIAVAAASGAMALSAPVYADSAADGSAAGSPGLIAGNTVQLPVHVPVNVCGNTVNVVGVLNPAAGNSCANVDQDTAGDEPTAPGGTTAGGGASAVGDGTDSPGVLSGNGVRLPVHLPVNVSGNGVSVVGVGNAAVGNDSANTPGGRPDGPDGPGSPERPVRPTPEPAPANPHPGPRHAPHHTPGVLAHTGTDQTLPAAVGSAALVLGGAAMYRRFRPRAAR